MVGRLYPSASTSRRRFFFRNNYVETVKNILARHNVPAGLLRVEVTESMAWLDETAFINTLNELSCAGIKLSLDDFGKGYSSLSMLSSFKFNTIKLDKAFLNTSEEKQTSAWMIIESLSELSKKMGIHILCEGVETELQREKLVEVGCRYGQGYFFAKPMPMEDFELFMDSRPLEQPA